MAAASELRPHRLGECLVSLADGRGEVSFGGGALQWRVVEVDGAEWRASGEGDGEQFDGDRIGAGIRLRHWRPGDRFRPIGMEAAVKLQDLFTNAHIPADQRRRLVIAETRDGDVFWVEGLRIGDLARLTERTRRRLIWQWRRP